ncbi:hypothetical protein HY605_00255, partial [Candidatus Peregrinibacteria bacterium]|nr:hypothetical protein [Candidatus Peregrinibacteria bacterium]
MKVFVVCFFVLIGAFVFAQEPVSFDREISRVKDLDKKISDDLKGIQSVTTAQNKLANELKSLVDAKKSGKEVPDAVNVLAANLGEIVKAHQEAIKSRNGVEQRLQEQCGVLQGSIAKIRKDFSATAKFSEDDGQKVLKEVAVLSFNEQNPIWKRRYAAIFKSLKGSLTDYQKAEIIADDFRRKMHQRAVFMLEKLLSQRLEAYVKIRTGFDDLSKNYRMYQTLYEVAKNLKAGKDFQDASEGTQTLAGFEGINFGDEEILTAIGDTLEKNMSQLVDSMEGQSDTNFSEPALDEEIKGY